MFNLGLDFFPWVLIICTVARMYIHVCVPGFWSCVFFFISAVIHLPEALSTTYVLFSFNLCFPLFEVHTTVHTTTQLHFAAPSRNYIFISPRLHIGHVFSQIKKKLLVTPKYSEDTTQGFLGVGSRVPNPKKTKALALQEKKKKKMDKPTENRSKGNQSKKKDQTFIKRA